MTEARPLHRVVHLSDLHLGAGADQLTAILDPLVRTLRELRGGWGAPPALLAITGDLHDSPGGDVGEATARLVTLLERIRAALGGEIPTVVVPGNHDRRTQGLLLPFREDLIGALARARMPRVVVGGTALPFLAEAVDDGFHGLPFAVALLDSSYTPTGLVSAGGLLRVEDLLELAELLALRGGDPGRPLLLLTHHHLIPTPVTDTARIDADTTNPALRWLAANALPRLISNADHEEWMMTAFGAGSLLSTLHALARPVLVLHGHKHFPTVRTLRASLHGQGDVALLAAGAAGLALALDEGDDAEATRLWPSFHVLEIDGPAVRVETVAYYGAAPAATRDLFHARADGASWVVQPVDDRIRHRSPRLLHNWLEVALRPCAGRPAARWDVDATRTLRADAPLSHVEQLRAAPGAVFEAGAGATGGPSTRSIRVRADGTPVRYRLMGGAVRTVEEALRHYGPVNPYEGVELLCRYESAEARLTLHGLPAGVVPFGSAVDLTRGRAVPRRVGKVDGGGVELVMAPCPPRTLLRIQWRPS